jgi:hypothetical protein
VMDGQVQSTCPGTMGCQGDLSAYSSGYKAQSDGWTSAEGPRTGGGSISGPGSPRTAPILQPGQAGERALPANRKTIRPQVGIKGKRKTFMESLPVKKRLKSLLRTRHCSVLIIGGPQRWSQWVLLREESD